MNVPGSREAMKYILPIVVGISSGCASTDVAIQGPQVASASEQKMNIGVLKAGETALIESNICEQGNEVWNKLQGLLSCAITNNEAIHAELQNGVDGLVDQMEGIVTSKSGNEIGLSFMSGEFDGTAFEMNDLVEGHHRCEVYWNEHQVIINIYKNVNPYDEKKGYTGTELYILRLGADSLSMRHMVNGTSCYDCSTMDFDFNPGETCGSYEMGETYGESAEKGNVMFGKIYAGKNNEDGENGLKCEKTSEKTPQPYATEDITGKCDDGSEAAASCREGENGSRYEGVVRSGKMSEAIHLANGKLFTRIQKMMGKRGINIPDLTK